MMYLELKTEEKHPAVETWVVRDGKIIKKENINNQFPVKVWMFSKESPVPGSSVLIDEKYYLVLSSEERSAKDSYLLSVCIYI